jgi:hypothetical protein
MRRAYELARGVWPEHASRFSRHDFTEPQLFACLVLREMMRLSYRKASVLLADSPAWLASIGMTRAPDHNTLWRAFGALVKRRCVQRMLDLLARLAAEQHLLKLRSKPLTIDSTCYEPRHRSRHYDRVCRKMDRKAGPGGRVGPGKWGHCVNRARSAKVRRMPKLSLAVASGCHLILAARARLGNGSDGPDFEPLLYRSWRRAPVRTVVADAGFDSEKNHELARLDMNVRSIIPPKIGRPSVNPPAERFRRLMKSRFTRKADQHLYSQRSQSETVNSMMKRNLGEALRSIRPERRRQELLIRSLTHDLMLC